jgi:hypothetical protein
MSEYITEEGLNRLRNSKDAQEWDATCDAIKKAHGGYPSDWWPKVMQSGLAAQVPENWGQPDAFEIKIEPL